MTAQQNIPALRFPEFKGEWDTNLFGSYTQFIPTNSLSRENLTYEEGTIFNIHYGDIHTKFRSLFRISRENVPRIKSEVIDERKYENSFLRHGDLVFADASEDYNDIGKCIEIIDTDNKKIVAGLHTLHARLNSGTFSIGFLGWLWQTNKVKNQIKRLAQGSKVLSITAGRLSEIGINFPSLPEQQKIAAFLTAVDEKIQQLTRKKALLEQYKQGVVQQLFSREIRFKPALSDLPRAESRGVEGPENGEEYPEWEERTMGELVTYPFTNSLSRSQLNYESGEVKNIHYGDIHTRFNTLFDITKEKVPFINEDIEIEKWNENVYCKTGDLIIADASEDYKDVGKAIEIINVGDEKLVAGLHTYIARPNEGVAATGFLGYLFQVDYVRKQIMTMATGISVLGISKTNLNKLVIDMPSIPEQQKITSFLSALDEKIGQVGQQLEQAKGWKKGLLQRMFV